MMGPPIIIVAALSLLCGGMATILMIVATATDHWEYCDFDVDVLRQAEGIDLNASILNEDEKFYRIAVKVQENDNITTVVHHLRATYGGIWRYCDTISDSFRENEVFATVIKAVPYFEHHCINYIPDFGSLKDTLDKEGLSLLRMQNSAASCSIVCVLCVLTAILTGAVALWQKQVSACMVTGVMHIVAGVFGCFATILMITKVTYMRNDCYTLEPLDDTSDEELCEARSCELGYSAAIGWTSFTFFLCAFICWLYLARCFRLEKAKSIL